MNCNTCRFELSQCLDGRLASGRRATVMQHAEACAACSSFWNELQAAQRLTLQLQRPQVGSDFRESLWLRIQAGEGTPEAVFRQPVPLMVKLRYALTGAAAAAAALLCATLFSPDREQAKQPVAAVGDDARPAMIASTHAPRGGGWHQDDPAIDASPLISSTQPLTFDLVAVETAKQLDQRYAAATMALRRLSDLQSSATQGTQGSDTQGSDTQGSDPEGHELAIKQVLENADEFHVFGELLLDLRDHKRLFFTDADVGADLRVAVDMLGQSRGERRDLRTVQLIVAPALRSNRLASISRTISLVPSLNPHEEMDMLMSLTMRRPGIFPKLFTIVLGNNAEMRQHFGVFLMEDSCGQSWVAPRSKVEAGDGRLRVHNRRGNGEQIEVQIEVRSSSK